jgi:hypothetical protein
VTFAWWQITIILAFIILSWIAAGYHFYWLGRWVEQQKELEKLKAEAKRRGIVWAESEAASSPPRAPGQTTIP